MKRKQNRLTVEFSIPAYWTPAEALVVFDLVNDLRNKIWDQYQSKIFDLLPEHYGCETQKVQQVNPDDIPF